MHPVLALFGPDHAIESRERQTRGCVHRPENSYPAHRNTAAERQALEEWLVAKPKGRSPNADGAATATNRSDVSITGSSRMRVLTGCLTGSDMFVRKIGAFCHLSGLMSSIWNKKFLPNLVGPKRDNHRTALPAPGEPEFTDFFVKL